MKRFLIAFFHFNKQERNGVFVLCGIIGILFIVRLTIPWFNGDIAKVQLITIKDTATTVENTMCLGETMSSSEQSDDAIPSDENAHHKRIFPFNPNTVSQTEAEQLGFSKKLAITLINYRNKGGKFFKPSDLKKLYGMSSPLYNALESYIVISNPTAIHSNEETVKKEKVVYEDRTKVKSVVEINTADSLSIVYLKGIGPSFTKRIIKYRTLLGGFHSLHQLHEVYGMTDSLYMLLCSQITLNYQAISKISINSIDFQTLRKHPYFNYQATQAIINYRTKHKTLTESDFKNLGVFSEEKLQLILPYLNF